MSLRVVCGLLSRSGRLLTFACSKLKRTSCMVYPFSFTVAHGIDVDDDSWQYWRMFTVDILFCAHLYALKTVELNTVHVVR